MGDDKARMLAGELYYAADETLAAERIRAKTLLRRFNDSADDDFAGRTAMLRELLGSMGDHAWFEPPLRCDYGYNIHLGDYFYANYDCIILDVCRVDIGDDVMLGPRVSLYTATHPIDPVTRTDELGLELGAPISIGHRVWIGGDTVVTPGVTIGDNAIIGAGSVVTKDVPPDVIAAGNPCRVLREINDGDRTYWRDLAERYRRERG